jgi:hypothetical protein
MAISRRHFVVGSGLAAATFSGFATATEKAREANDAHVAFYVIGAAHTRLNNRTLLIMR